jgi:hypothetical protein
MSLTDEALEDALTEDGWPFDRLDERTWRSAFQGPGDARFRFFLRLTDDWLFLTIIPFATLPADGVGERALMRRLLELNRTITLAKFALDGTQVVLTVELPTEELTATQIHDGLNALSYYALQYHSTISR